MIHVRAFSLVEVVLALAVMSFALISIIGLFTVGLENSRDSSSKIQAADTASLLMATIRASPTNLPADFAVGTSIGQGIVTNIVRIGVDGTTDSKTLSYNLYYYTGTNSTTGSKLAEVYLRLWWPLSAPMPTNNPDAYYDVMGQVALP